MIVHDMRTPLTNVITGLQTVRAFEEESELGAELVDGALSGANRLLLMVNDLLDISKMEAGQMTLRRERFSLEEVMAEAVSLVDALGREKRLILRQESRLPAGFRKAEADRDKTRRVLVNLLGNAIKFAPEESPVILEATGASDSLLCVSVVDTGPGIAPEHQARIFD